MEIRKTIINPRVSRMAFHLRASPVRATCAGDTLSKLRNNPIMPLEDTNMVNRKPNDSSSLLLVCIKSVIRLSADAYKLGLGDNSFIELRIVSCTESRGRKGTRENRKMSVGGIAVRKLKEMAAALSLNRISLSPLKKAEPISYTEAPSAPGIDTFFSFEKKGTVLSCIVFFIDGKMCFSWYF